jgi:uncharacterized membrane protein
MEGLIILLVMMAICGVLMGPVALVIAIIALNRSRELSDQLRGKDIISKWPAQDKLRTREVPTIRQVPEPVRPSGGEVQVPLPPPPEKIETEQKAASAPFELPAEKIKEPVQQTPAEPAVSLEQRIGTRWIAIAGTITVIVGVAFFLKYAYDNWVIGPLVRVLVTAAAGVVALVAGEVTRRRGYEIVAKCVTALGFGVLYVAVFSAYRVFGLIGTGPAFILAIVITAAAMFYAVIIDEVLIAVLSLFGGFCTPVLVSTGQNLPMPLFGYALVLGAGAMLCAYYRKWRAVNIIAFVGTFVLYTGWFEKFYRPAMRMTEGPAEQMAIALGWLAVFFAVYLVVPILYELINKVKADKEDILCVLANAAVVFYYLCAILFDEFRTQLAFCAFGLCLIHLAMLAVVNARCKDDVNLKVGLLAVAMFFLTVAMPLYFKMYALAMAWAAQGAILAVIGLRYRSRWTQAGSAVVLMLSLYQLLHRLPMHEEAFRLVFNPAFGTWCFVAAVLFVCSVIYRRTSALAEGVREDIAQIFYGLMGLLLMTAATLEWHSYCEYNLNANVAGYFPKGQVIIFAAMMMLFLVPRVCPQGMFCEVLGLLFAGGGLVAATVALYYFHRGSFRLGANIDFGVILIFIAAMAAYHIKYRQVSDSTETTQGVIAHTLFVLIGSLLFATIAVEWYHHCKYNMVDTSSYFSKGFVVILAAMMPLFVVRPVCPKGPAGKLLAMVLAGGGAIFTITAFTGFHKSGFLVFANVDFGIAFLFIAATFATAMLLRSSAAQDESNAVFSLLFVLAGILVLWILLTEEIYSYWYCQNRYVQPVANWKFLANMYISIMWAVYGVALMVAGFWRRASILRYIALGLFALLLAKVFILDMGTVESIYRIGAFLATGIALVGVSYLYQFLKKKGFFETMSAQMNMD